jgi:hypothetical protein
MIAKTAFDEACKIATTDSEELQLLYATYLKTLNYGADEELYNGLIYTIRYLKADYKTEDEQFFLNAVTSFSGDLASYITTTDEAERKRAHRSIITAFNDTTLFYPLSRTVPVIAENFTIGVNDDASRFAAIVASEPIALDGQNVTIPIKTREEDA